jgi:hypothetical protein
MSPPLRMLSHYQLDSSRIYLASSFCRWYYGSYTSQSQLAVACSTTRSSSRRTFSNLGTNFKSLPLSLSLGVGPHLLLPEKNTDPELDSSRSGSAPWRAGTPRRTCPRSFRSSGKTCSPCPRPARSPSRLWTGPSPRCARSTSARTRRTFCSSWTVSITRRWCVRCLQR